MSDMLSALPLHLSPAATALVFLGLILSSSILADAVASRTRLPRISLLVLVGLGVLLGGLPVAAGLTWLVLPGALWVAWRLPAVLEPVSYTHLTLPTTPYV